MENINWLSMAIAALIPLVTGFVWYHKAVFGKAWMTSIGMTDEKASQGNMGVVFGLTVVMSFLIAWFLVFQVNGPGQEGQYDTFKHGAFHGAALAILVGLPVLITNGLFERKSAKNHLINAGYWILTLTLMGGVLDVMNHW